jgi:putative ABC transport system substrate-binding protein
MRRRQFLHGFGSAAIAWPLVARAQQPAPGKWRVGMLAQDRELDAVRQGLRELGYREGSNLVVDVRAIDQADLLNAFATELVSLKPDVVLAVGTQAVLAVQQTTKTIPIVIIASDPVGTGLIASLPHPGGNTTGVSLFSPALSGKRIELLRTVAGGLSKLAVLWNPDDPPATVALNETQKAAHSLQVEVLAVEARRVQDFSLAFGEIGKTRPQALTILNAPLMRINGARIAELAASLRLPSIYTNPSYPKAGGLMSYGPDFDALRKRTAAYIDRIFKGTKPADLPVEQPTKFQLIINLKTANALGLTISPSLLALTDEVIE